ncbi:PTS sugar transporter subunit IIB [Lichenifustis flavocetrariae]|uniref:PTS sugar transporter subunit IIB n=1 Tax=Lichenifustis flavocetrariae TaxID=2949735 RepID=A0AA42CP21_9HYPH|nr:PTS sugar transporter subunit IIB [Lichenifustis flavocetrariae]MCW6509980.1 PTS sugar transporter subunit IIB [Lichenifustis flavocetrariae]
MAIKQKTILVACGTAVATSTLVAYAIEETMKERGLRVTIRQCKATEVPSLVADCDLIVATTPVPDNLGKPVIKGLPFLTGIGKADTLDRIEKILRE